MFSSAYGIQIVAWKSGIQSMSVKTQKKDKAELNEEQTVREPNVTGIKNKTTTKKNPLLRNLFDID